MDEWIRGQILISPLRIGRGHETLLMEPAKGMLILGVVDGVISFVEALHHPEIRQKLVALGLPSQSRAYAKPD